MEFPDMVTTFLPEGLFDHSPRVMDLWKNNARKRNGFKYFNMLGRDSNFLTIIVRKLKVLKKELRALNRDGFANIKAAARIAKVNLEQLQEKMHSDIGNANIQEQERADALVYMDLDSARNEFLAQKSKVQCLEEGDDNTHLFHSAIKSRRMQNKVLDIEDIHGFHHVEPTGIETAFLEYYKKFLGTSKKFYWDYFEVIGEDMCKAVMEVFDTVALLLPNIVSETHSAFIKGREIVDNIIICQDWVRLYNKKACSPRCMMKVDLRKAYNSIEWSFIEDILKALGFPNKMVGLIMECVTSPTFSLSLNENVFGYFEGRRGIRQGDPISPLLFIVCMEYFTGVLNVVTQRKEFRFHPLCKLLNLSHLCFVEDFLLFSRGDPDFVKVILSAFATFLVASGLEMNRKKSKIYCNGIKPTNLQGILNMAGFQVGAFLFKYLGIPISYKRLAIVEKSGGHALILRLPHQA
ncbi:uncharacterized protein LOC141601119 [Silene latifolia]|uniref:uncharacterized protein LOC141601119 n=1 Tax=Silene latifolia TaxID=37657 RepID=UPI003D777BD2